MQIDYIESILFLDIRSFHVSKDIEYDYHAFFSLEKDIDLLILRHLYLQKR